MSKKTIRVISRKSLLARTQTAWVISALQAAYPDQKILLDTIDTQGDQLLNQSLSQLGGKGLFTEALEQALLEQRADFAVHSLKDLPQALPEGLQIAAITQRECPFDALVSVHYSSLSNLPTGACVGTASLRRQAQLKHLRPDLNLMLLRGNVDTRLHKLHDGHFDALILARAGLLRLNKTRLIREILDNADCLPAAGQGALAIQCRANDFSLQAQLQALHHPETARLVATEREFNATLGGSCHAPIGALARFQDDHLILSGMVLSEDGQKVIQGEMHRPVLEADGLGQSLARLLLAKGAAELLPPLNKP